MRVEIRQKLKRNKVVNVNFVKAVMMSLVLSKWVSLSHPLSYFFKFKISHSPNHYFITLKINVKFLKLTHKIRNDSNKYHKNDLNCERSKREMIQTLNVLI